MKKDETSLEYFFKISLVTYSETRAMPSLLIPELRSVADYSLIDLDSIDLSLGLVNYVCFCVTIPTEQAQGASREYPESFSSFTDTMLLMQEQTLLSFTEGISGGLTSPASPARAFMP